MAGPVVWLNGSLLPAEAAAIDPADRGLLLGDGLFETIAVRDGRLLRLEAHLSRLRAGAGILGLTVPADDTDLEAAAAAVARANRAMPDGVVRLTLTAGPGPRGLVRPATPMPTLLATAGPLPSQPSWPPRPVRTIVARTTCRNELSPLSRVKSLNYLDGVLARREAVLAGADDALLLNSRGRLAEASAANLFVRVEGRWLTPPVAEGALPGIVRAALIPLLEVEERPLDPAILDRCDGALLSNSLGILQVAAVDGAELPGLEPDLPARLAGTLNLGRWP